MSSKRIGAVLVAAALSITGWTLVGRAAQDPADPQGPAESLGQKIDEALRDFSREARERFAQARTTVRNLGIEGRVYGRLHWDKALEDADLQLASPEKGVIVLRGAVDDEAARTTALTLARETVGVVKVVDELTIAKAAEPAPPRD